MARTPLPPGFRFHPTDVELIKYYLKRKVMGKKFRFEAIGELNIYKFSPWDLPDMCCLKSKDREWFFFCPRERRYASGSRMSRTTEVGYWKTTGKDRPVLYNEQTVGMIKTLVFHQGHAPGGERTDWVMHEYRIDDKDLADAGVVQDAYVLCKIFKKCGPGPKNGAQYGAFNEEEWDDDDDEDGPFPLALSLPNNPSSSVVTSMLEPESICTGPVSSPLALALPNNQSNSVVMLDPESICTGPLSEPCLPNAMPSADEVPPLLSDCDDFDRMLAMFVEESTLFPTENTGNQVQGSFCPDGSNGATTSCLDGNEIYKGLGDLTNWADLNGESGGFSYNLNPMFPAEDVSFLELDDLDYPLNYRAGGDFGKLF